MLCAKSDGTKIAPFIVLKGKKLPDELKNFRGASIVLSSNGWMNEETTIQWLDKSWGAFAFGRRLLSWDSFRSHKTPLVKKKLDALRTDVAMIPGGCTGILQAPDVSWNKPFKAAYVEQWLQERRSGFKNKDAKKKIGRRPEIHVRPLNFYFANGSLRHGRLFHHQS